MKNRKRKQISVFGQNSNLVNMADFIVKVEKERNELKRMKSEVFIER